MLGLNQSVSTLNGGVHVVQVKIELGDSPGAQVLFLPVKEHVRLAHQGAIGQVGHMVGALNQHAATAAGGVIHTVAGLRINQLNH
ncbi:hypothetical protein D9M70_494350 [compost metagenome]